MFYIFTQNKFFETDWSEELLISDQENTLSLNSKLFTN